MRKMKICQGVIKRSHATTLSLSLSLSAVNKEPKSQDNEVKGCKGQTIGGKKAQDPRTLNARAHRSAQW